MALLPLPLPWVPIAFYYVVLHSLDLLKCLLALHCLAHSLLLTLTLHSSYSPSLPAALSARSSLSLTPITFSYIALFPSLLCVILKILLLHCISCKTQQQKHKKSLSWSLSSLQATKNWWGESWEQKTCQIDNSLSCASTQTFLDYPQWILRPVLEQFVLCTVIVCCCNSISLLYVITTVIFIHWSWLG